MSNIKHMEAIAFVVPGKPTAKARARSFMQNGAMKHRTPSKTRRYENQVGLWCRAAMGAKPMLVGAIAVEITACFAPPKSWTLKKQRDALSGVIAHTSTPDCDNLAKSICDGLNGVAFKDDSQVTALSVKKLYSSEEGVTVRVQELNR